MIRVPYEFLPIELIRFNPTAIVIVIFLVPYLEHLDRPVQQPCIVLPRPRQRLHAPLRGFSIFSIHPPLNKLTRAYLHTSIQLHAL